MQHTPKPVVPRKPLREVGLATTADGADDGDDEDDEDDDVPLAATLIRFLSAVSEPKTIED